MRVNFSWKKKTNHTLINIGSGEEKTILGFAKFIIQKLNIDIKIKFDTKKPNGTPRKRLDINIAKNYGWESKFTLDQGFNITYKNFLDTKLLNKI